MEKWIESEGRSFRKVISVFRPGYRGTKPEKSRVVTNRLQGIETDGSDLLTGCMHLFKGRLIEAFGMPDGRYEMCWQVQINLLLFQPHGILKHK